MAWPQEADLAPAVLGHLAAQIGTGSDALEGYEWTGRTGRRHRRLILGDLALLRHCADDVIAQSLHRAPQLFEARFVRNVIVVRRLDADKHGERVGDLLHRD